jgi:hypothetical protein
MGMFLDYVFAISVVGCAFMIFFSFCCFLDMEALHLKPGTKVARGFGVFCAAIVCYIFK